MATTFIDKKAKLDELATRLSSCGAIALDTEFLWERTYYPQLGLVQIADDSGECWLVDPVTIGDISPLAPILESESIVKVLHDAGQDLMILARATGATPKNTFDTRLGAGFAGLVSTLSLQKLVAEMTGVELPKDETRSNWVARPLRPQQLKYAADDVAYLLTLREKIIEKCADDEVRSWLAEEMPRRAVPSDTLDRDPRESWRRVSRFGALLPRSQAVLCEISAWREECAREHNVPRARWVSDEALFEIARVMPRDGGTLMSIRGVPQTWARDRRAATVIGLVLKGMEAPLDAFQRHHEPSAIDRDTLKKLVSEMRADIEKRAVARLIDPAIVASRAEVESYILARETGRDISWHPFLNGWRKTLLGL